MCACCVRETYVAFERVDLAGVGLDLVSELHGLLPGLLQRLVVLTHCLVQVGHLETQRSKVRHCSYFYRELRIKINTNLFIYNLVKLGQI